MVGGGVMNDFEFHKYQKQIRQSMNSWSVEELEAYLDKLNQVLEERKNRKQRGE